MAGLTTLRQQLRPIGLIALVPGVALLMICYGVDFPSTDQGVYPMHVWSAAGAVVGWSLLVASLVALAKNRSSLLIGGLSALALMAGPLDNVIAFIGFFTAYLLLALASAAVVLRSTRRWTGRFVWSLVLLAIGATAAFVSQRFSSTPVLDSPPIFFLSGLSVAPIFIGAGATLMWLGGRSEQQRELTRIRTSQSIRVRPRLLGWLINGLLLLFAAPLIGLGTIWLTSGDTGIGLFFIGLGLPLAVLPTAYFATAHVTLANGVLAKTVLFGVTAHCPAQSVTAIAWHRDPLASRGYEFRTADGRAIFRLSAFWWSDTDVAKLGQPLGLAVEWAPIGQQPISQPMRPMVALAIFTVAIVGLVDVYIWRVERPDAGVLLGAGGVLLSGLAASPWFAVGADEVRDWMRRRGLSDRVWIVLIAVVMMGVIVGLYGVAFNLVFLPWLAGLALWETLVVTAVVAGVQVALYFRARAKKLIT